MNQVFCQSKSHAIAWLFLSLSCGFTLTSCDPTSDEEVNEAANENVEAHPNYPRVPIQLAHDTTIVYLNDFISHSSKWDSIIWENGAKIPIDTLQGESVFRITSQPKQALGFVQLWAGGNHLDIPVLKNGKIKTIVTYNSEKAVNDVKIIGGFTNWQSAAKPLEQITERKFEIELFLDPGVHPYQLVIDGIEQPDPNNPRRVSNGFGSWNSILEVGDQNRSLDFVLSFQPAKQEGNVQNAERFFGQTQPNAWFYAWHEDSIYAMGQADSNGVFQIGIPAHAYDMNRSHLRVWSTNERLRSQEALIPLEFGQPIQQTQRLNRFDRQAMVMYFLMVDRFKNGDVNNDWKSDDPAVMPQANHYGGDLEGVRQQLDYIDSLGANTVWVSPITPNPDHAWGFWSDPKTEITSKFSGYHGYWPISSTGVDRRFGTMQTLNELIKEAHAKDQNVLVDYVANHVHQDHPVYQTHPDWVTNLYLPDGSMNTQLWDEQRLTTWFDTFMPTLDLEKQEVVETMTDSAIWWIQNTKIDGFRHDATKHIPEGFWRMLTKKIRENQAQPIFQIGETYGSPELIRSYLSNGMLDAQFDFNLYDALIAAFTPDSTDLTSLIEVANQSLDTYGAHHLMGNITGNQDRPRFTSLADGSLLPGEDTKFAGWTRSIEHGGNVGYRKMSWLMTFLMSSPGIPCIYYGDEIADVGGNDPDNRRMMRFTGWNKEEQWIWDWTQKWIALRNSRMSLIYGQTAYSELAPGLLAIHRQYLDENTWVLINTTSVPYVIESKVDSPLSPLIGTLEKNENGANEIKPWGCAAFDVKPNAQRN
ncbi:MAG: alpha-amylase family glycosyl hydrolase [Bacteroidetes bacterium]|nr:alpha-amylase family glycosyl hydrolase [Bacteroidota bacterium]MDA1335884.1 alpha-amylase family glycosyl hydrolase [Bacteroidota bacterium]